MPREVDLKATKRIAKGQGGLLASLARPRISAADPYIGYRKKEKEASPTGDHHPESHEEDEEDEDYHGAKISAAEREYRREVLEVASLNHQSIPLPQRPCDGLVRQSLMRRERHETAVRDYEARVRELSDQLEEKVLAVSREVQDSLEEVDRDITNKFNLLRDDNFLVSIDIKDVQQMWDSVDELYGRRSREVAAYASKAEEVECSRLALVGAETAKLVDTLVKIAHQSPNEVERLAEDYGTELNQVLVSNRKTSAELLAILEKMDVVERQKGKLALEERQRAWRRLKHELAIRTFHVDISCDFYTNPTSRQETLTQAKAEQLVRHDERMEILCRLSKQTHPTLSSNEVKSINSALEELHGREEEATATLLAALEERKRESASAAEARREALRVELHTYAHLESEPTLKGHAGALEAHAFGSASSASIASSSSSSSRTGEHLWSRAGDLKSEIKAIIKGLRDARTIYPDVLGPLISRLSYLLGAEKVEEACHKGGKPQLRKAAEDTVETLRKALKSEVPPIWTALNAHLTEMLSLPDLDPNIRLTLQNTLPLFAKAYEVPSGETDVSGSRSRAGRSRAGTPTSSHSPARTPKSGRSFFGDSGPDMDMNLVRSVQKRLACILHVKHLPEAVRLQLHAALEDCRQQERCNGAVDEVVATECTEPLAERQSEQAVLIGKVDKSLRRHTSHLHTIGERLTAFYEKLALEVEDDRSRNDVVNDTSAKDMKQKLEDFQAEDKAREGNVDKRLDRVRHAADNKELETSFEAALQLLEEVERSYRTYHKEASALALQHPLAVKTQNIKHRYTICTQLGLVSHLGSPGELGKEPLVASESTPAVQGEPEPPKQATNERRSSTTTNERRASTNAVVRRGSSVRRASALKGQAPQEATTKAEDAAAEPSQAAAAGGELYNPSGYRTPYTVSTSLATLTTSLLAAMEEASNNVVAQAAAAPLQEEERTSAPPAPPAVVDPPPLVFTPSYAQPPPKGKKAPPLPPQPKWFRAPFLVLMDDDVAKIRAETPHLMQVYYEQRDAAFIALATEEVATLDEKSRATYEAVEAVVRERREEKERAKQQEEAKKAEEERQKTMTPRDKDDQRCIERPMVPADTVLRMLSALRDSLILAAEEATMKRQSKADQLYRQRADFLTEELEEKLRMHWPRKGRTEVSFKDPREGELIAHRNKAERHVRILADRNSTHEEAFTRTVATALEHCTAFTQVVQDFQASLPSQVSIAAFQGLDVRCKKVMAQFMPQCEEDVAAMETYIKAEPTKLLNSNSELLRTCKLFMEGGEYDQKELDLLRAKLERPTKGIEASVDARREKVKEVVAAQEKAWSTTKAYRDAYDAAVLDLCLREGLGQKYGAPRRAAQERLRTELTRDDKHAKQLEALLTMLETLCQPNGLSKLAPRAASNKGSGSSSSDLPSTVGGPLSVAVRKVLIAIRKCSAKRGAYLEYLKASPTLRVDTAVPLDLEGEGDLPGDVEVPDMTTGTFTKALTSMEEECKAATKKLYEGDGKKAALGSDGIPDSLKVWLEERRGKALGQGGIRSLACQRFAEHVRRLEMAVGKATPAPDAAGERAQGMVMVAVTKVALEDIAARARAAADLTRRAEEETFALKYNQWEELKEKHRRQLRPRLGSPDAAADLQALQNQESQRYQEVQGAITSFRKSIIAAEAQAAKQFVARFSAAVKALAVLLDSLPAVEDVGDGGEVEDPKAKPAAVKKPDNAATKRGAAPIEVTDPFPDWSRSGWERTKWGAPSAIEKLAGIMTATGGVEASSTQTWVKENSDASTVFSFKTRAHEQLMQAREDVLESYVSYYREASEGLGQRYDRLVEREETWLKRWDGMVANLVSSSKDIV